MTPAILVTGASNVEIATRPTPRRMTDAPSMTRLAAPTSAFPTALTTSVSGPGIHRR